MFDNIQEGLFFSTPEGRFVEVNDALVAMLGYSSREELLQVDIPTQVYFSPEQRLLHSQAMEEHGHMRNYEATLRRKTAPPSTSSSMPSVCTTILEGYCRFAA